MKQHKKIFAAAVFAVFCLCCISDKAAASESINSISVKVTNKIEAGDRLPEIGIDDTNADVNVKTSAKQYHISDVKWVTSTTKDMTIGEQPKMNVTLTPSDEYDAYFKSSYTASKVKISGGSYVSAKRSGSELIITLRTNPIKGLYAEPEDVGWKDTRLGRAVWSKGDNTSGAYEFWLYRGKKVILKKEKLKATTFNCYPYMTEEGTYSFKVRSVPYKDDELKNGKKSGWVEADELVIRDKDVSDGTGKEDDKITDTNASSETKEGWSKQSGVWYYRYADGTVQADSWMVLDNVWYRFDHDGKMVTGWFLLDGDIYYMDSSGAMLTGWNEINDTWYYFYPDKGYEAPMGAAATGWQVVDGYQYCFSPQGAMKEGWLNQVGKWYYFNTVDGNMEGTMVKGLFTRNGKTYYTDQEGVMLTGWQKIDGYWRYFYKDGTMAVDTAVDGFKVNEDGVWIQE